MTIDPDTRIISTNLTEKKVSGLKKLVQMIAKIMLTTAGSSLFNNLGGNLEQLSISNVDFNTIYPNFVIMIDDLEERLLTDQAGLELDPDETLKELTPLGHRIQERNIQFYLLITNVSGERTIITV